MFRLKRKKLNDTFNNKMLSGVTRRVCTRKGLVQIISHLFIFVYVKIFA